MWIRLASFFQDLHRSGLLTPPCGRPQVSKLQRPARAAYPVRGPSQGLPACTPRPKVARSLIPIQPEFREPGAEPVEVPEAYRMFILHEQPQDATVGAEPRRIDRPA